MNARHRAVWLLLAALLITTVVYWPGLSGSWLFDDYPNIVDNPGVHPHEVSIPALVRAALSSPASEFKRPMSSLSFAANYLVSGLAPYSWKLANLIIHLLNGVLVYLLAKALLRVVVGAHSRIGSGTGSVRENAGREGRRENLSRTGCAPTRNAGTVAALIAGGWMLLPINLTGVLYVVQREESLANLFVLIGLVGYVAGRRRMLDAWENPLPPPPCKQGEGQSGHAPFHTPGEEKNRASAPSPAGRGGLGWGGFWLCTASLILPTALGLLAKETAVMLPLYAFLIEATLFRFSRAPALVGAHPVRESFFAHRVRSYRMAGLFIVVLLLPMLAGLGWLLPNALNPSTWATRDFTLGTRLLSEARIICDYIAWTLLPTPHVLSFYHDQYPISAGLLSPWTTLASILALAGLVAFAIWQRNRRPLVALGVALFLGCQLLTGTVLPLELVYEHRNYFASFGLLLAVVPWLVGHAGTGGAARWARWGAWSVLAGLMLWWAGLTAATAFDWGDPLRLAETLAARAPDSPRAQYELGRSYIMYSHYNPASPYTRLAYAPLERAAALPKSSILPQQALIYMNSRMHLPLKNAWWDSLIAKLKARAPGVQDESSLQALTQCARGGHCTLPEKRMVQAFQAALDHPHPSARLQATYGDYAWNVMGDRSLGLRMTEAAVKTAPDEPAYHITLARMQATMGHINEAATQIKALKSLDIGGQLDSAIHEIQLQTDAATPSDSISYPDGPTRAQPDNQHSNPFRPATPHIQSNERIIKKYR
jgi:hypothetical protein